MENLQVIQNVKQTNADLTVTIIKSMDELEAHALSWDAFIEEVNSDIYFTVDWLATWWEFYGQNREFRGYIVRDQEKIVAVLPFSLDKFILGGLNFRLARLTGSDSTIVVLNPAVLNEYLMPVLSVVLDKLTTLEKCDAVCFSPLSEQSGFVEFVRSDTVKTGDLDLFHLNNLGPHILFKLPETFDEYFNSLTKNRRKAFKKDERNLNKRFEIVSKVVEGQEALDYFQNFAELHTAQWKTLGRLGHFKDWPKSLAFNHALVEKFSTKGLVKFFEYSGDGAILSIIFSFEFGTTSFCRLGTRDLNPEFERFGHGRVGLVKVLEALISEGKKTVDVGPGHYDYKLALGGEEYKMQQIVFSNGRKLSQFKTSIFLKWSEFLHLAYYRIWFLKIAPRLRLNGKALWGPWIRTRL